MHLNEYFLGQNPVYSSTPTQAVQERPQEAIPQSLGVY